MVPYLLKPKISREVPELFPTTLCVRAIGNSGNGNQKWKMETVKTYVNEC